MRKLARQFLNSYLNSHEDKSLDSAIMAFMKNYKGKTVGDIAITTASINNQEDLTPEVIENNCLDVALNLRQVYQQGMRAIDDQGLTESVRFVFITVDGYCIKSMSENQRKKVYANFEEKARTCHIFQYQDYHLNNSGDNFTLDWFLPIPLKYSKFSRKQIAKIQNNILKYFETHFHAEGELCWWGILSQPDIRGVNFLYDNIIFPEVYFKAFGLELDYRILD